MTEKMAIFKLNQAFNYMDKVNGLDFKMSEAFDYAYKILEENDIMKEENKKLKDRLSEKIEEEACLKQKIFNLTKLIERLKKIETDYETRYVTIQNEDKIREMSDKMFSKLMLEVCDMLWSMRI